MQTRLREWEYYGLADTFTELYERSSIGESFNRLYGLITKRENILLAYRRIKNNIGSLTAGTDQFTIDNYRDMDQETFVKTVRNELKNYKPKAVRRKFIPKSNGDFRPLGIPTMFDRLIQQMFKQVLEPIAEAKLFNHSYGFRPLRSAHHAKARCDYLINRSQLHFVVDIDIKGFFDNVNHSKLIKQLWNIGIQDRQVLAIISKMLKAPIKGLGIPSKGVPQGGILSPLLSNIVLNDLDHWIAGQWENFEAKHEFAQQSSKFRALKESNLKEGYIVRYADDFKIICRDYKTAIKWFYAVKEYLLKRLGLEISSEKSKIINLRKRSSEFLGFELRAKKKKDKRVAVSRVRKKKLIAIIARAKTLIKEIAKERSIESISKWNSFVLGIHNYFKYASHVGLDFEMVLFRIKRLMYNRFKEFGKYELPINMNDSYKRLYGKNNWWTWKIKGIYLFPIADIKTENNLCYSQNLSPYTATGRNLIHKKISPSIQIKIEKLMKNTIKGELEYLDNRLSRYSMVKGKCEITKWFLYAEEVHCHHFVPIYLGGSNRFDNLRIIHKDLHKLIHATKEEVIEKYLNQLKLTKAQIIKVNQYRKSCKLESI
ncbi:group II intron reverse transcriptase/maturase [Heyndrickxia oleronia]|uniref:group II intron reverse transcriptase/maturase n=1 Tax=Heyndrickxia oleronia TaxID=38875 RepID=UPI00204168CB|nr:group II intron reverse transcriptase/maturase [Heyndrickxia oleronia]MCM3454774.1 group II intron reverse transcriptase/maturase [Heyndrickxia oleronia]